MKTFNFVGFVKNLNWNAKILVVGLSLLSGPFGNALADEPGWLEVVIRFERTSDQNLFRLSRLDRQREILGLNKPFASRTYPRERRELKSLLSAGYFRDDKKEWILGLIAAEERQEKAIAVEWELFVREISEFVEKDDEVKNVLKTFFASRRGSITPQQMEQAEAVLIRRGEAFSGALDAMRKFYAAQQSLSRTQTMLEDATLIGLELKVTHKLLQKLEQSGLIVAPTNLAGLELTSSVHLDSLGRVQGNDENDEAKAIDLRTPKP